MFAKLYVFSYFSWVTDDYFYIFYCFINNHLRDFLFSSKRMKEFFSSLNNNLVSHSHYIEGGTKKDVSLELSTLLVEGFRLLVYWHFLELGTSE